MLLSRILENIEVTALDYYKDFEVFSVTNLKLAHSCDISYFNNMKYRNDLMNTKAGAVFIKENHISFVPKIVQAIVCLLYTSPSPRDS